MEYPAFDGMNKTITIFGSSLPKPGEHEYEQAYFLGNYLGNNGFNVCSGGYQGIMDAVSKGAVKSGTKAIGVTVDIFGAEPSKYLSDEIVTNTLFERLEDLLNIGDAYIVLPGGTGTMLELTLVWEKMNKGLINEKPFACVGSIWKNIVSEMEERILFERRKTGLLKYFDNVEKCADYIMNRLSAEA